MSRLETFRRHLLSTVTLCFPAILGFYRGAGDTVATAVRKARLEQRKFTEPENTFYYVPNGLDSND